MSDEILRFIAGITPVKVKRNRWRQYGAIMHRIYPLVEQEEMDKAARLVAKRLDL